MIGRHAYVDWASIARVAIDVRWARVGKAGCLVGVHDWSEWKPRDAGESGRQIRTCVRCERVKFNDVPVPGRWQDNPPGF